MTRQARPPPGASVILTNMSEWGRATFGDPCHQCRFRWTMTQEEAVALVTAIPGEFTRLVEGIDGSHRHPDLTWPVVAYVCHVSDNLRIWAERLAALALGDLRTVAPFDQDLLAKARHYDDVSLAGALWSLDRAVDDWNDAVLIADHASILLVHPERGEQTLADVVRTNAHDAFHHGWDIQRTTDSIPDP